MYKKHTLAIVVPAYNEETQIRKVVETIPDYVDNIIIIDDCSKDKTKEVVIQLQKSNKKVVLLTHEKNTGVGGAIATGYKWARDHNIDVAVVMAGDGQMDPEDLPALIEPIILEQVDYAKGNRLFYGEAFKLIPKIRYFGNAVLSLLTKIASGYWHVADSQAGYTALNKAVLHTINWDTMYKRYGQPNDLLVRLNVGNFKVRDIPVRPVYNVGEKSDMKIYKVIFSISFLIIKLFFWRLKEKYIIRDFHPLVFFYFSGFILGIISIFFLGMVFYKWPIEGHVPEISLMSWMFSTALSFQFVFFAMWFDMQINHHLR